MTDAAVVPFRATVSTPALFTAFALAVVIIVVVGHIVWRAHLPRRHMQYEPGRPDTATAARVP